MEKERKEGEKSLRDTCASSPPLSFLIKPTNPHPARQLGSLTG